MNFNGDDPFFRHTFPLPRGMTRAKAKRCVARVAAAMTAKIVIRIPKAPALRAIAREAKQ